MARLTTQMDPLPRMIEAACEAAIKRAMNISDISPPRLLSIGEQLFTSVSPTARSACNMLATRALTGVRHGKGSHVRHLRLATYECDKELPELQVLCLLHKRVLLKRGRQRERFGNPPAI